MLRTVIFFLTIGVICEYVNTESGTGCCKGCDRIYTRVKRGKYYHGPPERFYNRPPISYPINGPFSYTPPPFTDEGPRYPGPGPHKVSKPPTNNGLAEEDLNNLIKYLTKQDLDKIIQRAYDKDNNVDYHETKTSYRGSDKVIYKEGLDTKFSYKDLNVQKPHEVELSKYISYVTEPTLRNVYPSDNGVIPTGNLYTEENIHNSKASHPYIAKQIPAPDGPFIKDSYEEERLPKPVNMRDDDFEVSYTNNVPAVVKAEPDSYKVEDFGNLPLMNYYDSKLHTVSSYHVPHYTVTQPQSLQASSSSSSSSLLVPSPGAASIKVPPVEPSYPISAAKEQSDAHLKATKIWSHRSKGTAYTLHDDGTLTLERPGRPKYG